MGVAGRCYDALQHLRKVCIFGRLFTFACGKAEIGVDHFFHFDKIGTDGLGIFGLAHQRQLQPDSRQWCPQVVTDSGQHLGALVQLAHDPMAHGLKGAAGKPDLACAFKSVILGLPPQPECARGIGKAQDRLDLPAHEQQCHSKKQDR